MDLSVVPVSDGVRKLVPVVELLRNIPAQRRENRPVESLGLTIGLGVERRREEISQRRGARKFGKTISHYQEMLVARCGSSWRTEYVDSDKLQRRSRGEKFHKRLVIS